MSGEDGFVGSIVATLSRALTPLTEASASAEDLGALLARLGWTQAPPVDVVAAVAGTAEAIAQLAGHVADGATVPTSLTDVVEAIGAIVALRAARGSIAPYDSANFWSELPEDLVALLLCDELRASAPGVYGVMSFAGAVRVETRAADSASGRGTYNAVVLDWGALGRLVSAPSSLLTDVYGWGARFDHVRFLAAIGDLAAGTGTSVARLAPPSSMLSPYMSAANPDRGRISMLSIAPFAVDPPTLGATLKASLLVLPIPPAGMPADVPEGILLRPMLTGAAQTSIDLGAAATLRIEGDFQASPASLEIRPEAVVVARADASSSSEAWVEIAPPGGGVLIGIDSGTRIEFTRAHLGLEIDGSAVTLEAGLDDASAVISFAGADSFLRGVLGDGEARLPLAGVLSWSSVAGLRIAGTTIASIVIPVDLRIAEVVEVDTVRIGVAPVAPDGVALTVDIDGGFTIGPLTMIAERLGLSLELAPTSLDAPGNLGLVDVSLGFLPPTGLGIGVDLEGVVTGGGFLSIDDGRYAGVAALQFLGVGLTVVGIVETELPDDPDGWSMFLSVIADFTPVPLGFGFFLSGVGGFMGLHRTLDEIALAEGAREGRLDSLLFPEDPLADAIRIIADIEAYFPTLQDTHAFGAMARIDWGVPALISGELGIVVVVPDFRIAVVGEIESILPTPQAPLIELHMSVVGYIDPAELTFWVTASIYDSRLVWYALSGDMAMYVSLGDDPYFLLSVGGFHPDWSPPKSVPGTMRSLRRMSAAIDLGEDLQVGLDAYFALTSNTLQFGAEVFAIARMRELGVDFSAEGSFGFDVLVIFTPFSIVAEMSAQIAIKAEGETLLATKVVLHLEGPEPWYGRATATFNFLGQPIAFNVTVGGHVAADAPDTIDVWEELEPALREPASWVAPVFDAGTMPEITLRPLDSGIETGLWLAPDGAVELRQRVVPLNRTIERFGAFVPAGETRFTVEAAGLASGVETERHTITDWFAPAQFVAMRAEERLSAPSFEEMDAGVSFGASDAVAPVARDDVAAVDLAYEELVLEDETRGIGVMPFDAGLSAIEMWPVQSSAVSLRADRAVSGVSRFGVEPARYDVADPLDATRVAAGGSYADAVVARRAAPGASRTRIVARQEIAA